MDEARDKKATGQLDEKEHPPVDLDNWRKLVYEAIASKRRMGAFSLVNELIGFYGLYFMWALSVGGSGILPAIFLAPVVMIGISFVLSKLEIKRIRWMLRQSDLIERFLNASDEFREYGVRFGEPAEVYDTAHVQTKADLRKVHERLVSFIAPPRGGISELALSVAAWLSIGSTVLYLIYDYIVNGGQSNTVQVNLFVSHYLPALMFFIPIAYFSVRKKVWEMEFSSALSKELGVDLVYADCEIALGRDEIATRANRHILYIRRLTNWIAFMFFVGGIVLSIFGFIENSVLGLAAIASGLMVSVLVIIEYFSNRDELKEGIRRSAVINKLINLEYETEQFSLSAKLIATLLLAPHGKRSIIRAAMVLSQNLGEYMPLKKAMQHFLHLGVGVVFMLFVSYQAILYELELMPFLLLIFGLAVVSYIALHYLVVIRRRMISMLECLINEMHEDTFEL